MLLHPAVPWISNSLVQLQSKRQDQETPKGCAVTAEQRDEVSVVDPRMVVDPRRPRDESNVNKEE